MNKRIFLDIGAWKGDTARSVLNSGYTFDKIYCFEPQIGCCDSIKKNIKADNVIVNEFGLSNKTYTGKIYHMTSSIGATMYQDKWTDKPGEVDARFVSASEWFKDNIEEGDTVVMKLNCEGAECDIMDDLFDSGEYKKIYALVIDFDARKIPSQNHRQKEITDRMESLIIPFVHVVCTKDRIKWQHNGTGWVHFYLDKIHKYETEHPSSK